MGDLIAFRPSAQAKPTPEQKLLMDLDALAAQFADTGYDADSVARHFLGSMLGARLKLAWDLPDDEIASPAWIHAVCAGIDLFSNMYIPDEHPCFLLRREVKQAINEVHAYATRHRWRTATGTLVLMLRHLENPTTNPNPLPVIPPHHCEQILESGLSPQGFLMLENHLASHPEDMGCIPEVITSVLEILEERKRKRAASRGIKKRTALSRLTEERKAKRAAERLARKKKTSGKETDVPG